ncbi:MAG: LacI family DNA-binding transcriptional regulator [Chloroflexia bacterium]
MRSRRITSQDVANRAGVSRTTVSFVLNDVKEANISEETRQRVLAAAEELQYVPDATAQALASGRTRTLGMVFRRPSNTAGMVDLAHMQILLGLMSVTSQAGVRLLVDIVNERDPADIYLGLSRNKRIDGLILSDPRIDDSALYDLLNDDFPIVLLGRLPGATVSWVEFHNRGGARAAVDHLVSQGHKQIAFIGYAPPYFTGVTERLAGYRDALAAAGIRYDERIVGFGDYNDASTAFALTTRWLELPEPPTAIFVSSDMLALATLAAIHQHGLSIPDDVAVVGFDDNPLSRYADPPLTSVYLPFEEMGRRAGEMLLDLLLHPDEPKREMLLDGQLIVRKSSSRRL